MKYVNIWHDFRTFIPFKRKRSSGHFKLKLLTNFDVKPTSFLGEVVNNVLYA